MDNETLRILNVYRGQPTEPPSRKEFAAITKSDYQATADDKWRHDNSNSVFEMKKMSLYEPMRSKWWVRLDDKKKKKTPTPRTPEAPTPKPAKRTPKKKKTPTTPQLVDKPPNDEAQHVDDNVAGGDNEIFSDEIENIIAAQDATKAAKNAEKVSGEAGGEKTGGEKVETVKEAFEEGVVHTDSSETESDIDLTEIAPTTGHKGKRDRKAGPSRKRKNSDDEDATYVPSPAEVEKIKKGRGKMKRKAQLTGENLRKLKIRKTTTKAVKDTIGESVQIPAERVESVAVEQSKNVKEPGSTTKKASTPKQQGSNQSFPDVPYNLDAGPTHLEDIGDIPFFNDEIVDALAKRVAELEKAKVETDAKLKVSDEKLKVTEEKLKNVEAKNIVLKNEVLEMNEKIEDLQVGNNTLNEMIDELLTTNVDLNDSNATLSAENELIQKALEDLKIGIRIAEAQRMKREQRDAQEVADAAKDEGKGIVVEEVLESSGQKEQQTSNAGDNVDMSIVLTQQFTLDDEEGDEKDDEEGDDDEDEDTEELFKDIDDYHGSDDGDDDDQGRDSGALIVRQAGAHQVNDFLDDTQNSEHEEVHPQGESSSGTKRVDPVDLFSSTPKVIYLSHDVEEGELVENWTRETMKESLGLNDEDNFTFDFEKDMEDDAPDSEYMFKMVDEADKFNEVVVEDDLESDQDVPFHYANKDSKDFPTFIELFQTHNED
ncbi:glutamic acid-rich protein-like [Helianthus annuus]|uniref:glutamic acid-rich protein-like n=1 Tax=Helianthus annuus TaxID=4232 RepID=UPI000B90A421|nr:glutamic acid-rich protein-like [Helianthus annuus]